MALVVNIENNLKGFHLKVNFSVDNTVLGFLGASGSGKSMTLRCIAGLETPTHGQIMLDDEIFFDSEKGINLPSQQRKIGFLFQNYALFPHMTVEENIAFPLYHLPKKEREKRVSENIEIFHLTGLEKRYPIHLSGGQQQRVALARAMAIQPKLILLDEPFSALDNHLRNQMEQQIIESLSRFSGSTLFVTHNIDEAYRVCEQLIVFSDGQLVANGHKEDIFNKPPSFEAAKLTGCKNIFKAKKIDDNTAYLEELEEKVTFPYEIKETLTYVGLRAHHLQKIDKLEENTFKCYVTQVIESTFRVMVYLSKTPNKNSKGQILWDISKEAWEMIKDLPQPWPIQCIHGKLFPIYA